MNIKNIFKIILIFLCCSLFPIYGQVVELGPITTGLQSAQATDIAAQLVKTAEILEATKNSIEEQVKQVNIMQREIDSNIEQLRHLEKPESIAEMISLVDEQISFVRTMEDNIVNASFTIGNNSIPLTEFYKVDQISDLFAEDIEEIWSSDYTDEEKATIFARYGLNAKNYMYVIEKQKQIAQLGVTTKLLFQRQKDKNELNMTAIKDLREAIDQNPSEKALTEGLLTTNTMMIESQTDTNLLLGAIAEGVGMLNSELNSKPVSTSIGGGASSSFINNILESEF